MRGCRRVAAVVAALAASALAQSSGIGTYCNPIDIDYRYNFEQLNEGISYRSAADAVVVPHGGEYYLFATISGGYWRSRDLIHWSFVTPGRWPMEDICAPAALSVDGTLYLYQSTFEQRPILSTREPATGRLEFFNRLLPPLPGQPPNQHGPWDPDIFHDPDTGRWFMYWGSSDTYPIWGIELDFARRLAWMGEPKELIRLDPERHGWERFGRDHREARPPFVEGAHMTKHGGMYYLQYAAPGTEYNVYANGVYVGRDPLGPFTYAPNNPVSYRPGGFATGAGHGCTFRDNHGNWWNTGTPWVGVNWPFERRLAMFPAGFDAAGRMFADTRFGDFPHRVPGERWSTPDELFTGWMLLSYRKPATASSALPEHPPAAVTDEDPRTFWVAAATGNDQWVTVDLSREVEVRAVQVDFADYESGLFANDASVYTQFRLSTSRDGAAWTRAADLTGERRDRPNAYVELPRPVRARYLRYEHVHVGARHLAISDIRVFGSGGGAAPRTPAGLAVRRAADPRGAFVSWQPVPGAVGYNVRWGIAADALYQTYQRFADEGAEVEVRALTVGQEYAFAVEAFDENGVSPLSAPVRCP
jgi:xylan 1,4-beta-xylosidase